MSQFFIKFVFTQVLLFYTSISALDDGLNSIILYDFPQKQGEFVAIELKGCKNVPAGWNDRASSLSLVGRCAQIYKDGDCMGKMMEIPTHNRLWLQDLKNIEFNNMISSVSPCRLESPTVQSGRYVIQSPWNKAVLTVRRLVGGYTVIKTEDWRKDLTQQWDIESNGDGSYWVAPRMFQHNSLTYKMKSGGKSSENPTDKNEWVFESLNSNMYMIRKNPTDLCLSLKNKIETELKECRKDDKRQHWIFHRIKGGSNEE